MPATTARRARSTGLRRTSRTSEASLLPPRLRFPPSREYLSSRSGRRKKSSPRFVRSRWLLRQRSRRLSHPPGRGTGRCPSCSRSLCKRRGCKKGWRRCFWILAWVSTLVWERGREGGREGGDQSYDGWEHRLDACPHVVVQVTQHQPPMKNQVNAGFATVAESSTITFFASLITPETVEERRNKKFKC